MYLPVASRTRSSSGGMSARRSATAWRCFFAHPAPKNQEMADAARKLTLKPIEVIVALSQDERRAAVSHRLDDIVADVSISSLVVDQFPVEALKRNTLIRIGSTERLERRRTDDHRVREGPRGRLHPGIHPMPDRTTLHEDDRMMAVFTGHGRGQARDESSLGVTRYLFKAVCR